MRKVTLLIAAVVLAAGSAFAAPPQHAGHGQAAPRATQKRGKAAPKRGAETTVTGYVSDSHCGLMHMSGMGDEQSCTLACVKGGGQFVLADHAKKVVYTLDKDGQEKAREFAGREVRVTGHVTGKTIHVTKIEAAS